MNSTPLKASVLAGILISSSLLLASPTSAAGPTQRNTNANVTFEMLLPVDVVDPLDPDTPKTPGDGEGDVNTGEGGELTLDFAPNLYFGSHKIKKDMEYVFPALVNAAKATNPEEQTSDPFIQVTDRQMKPGNWSVSVNASSFISDQTKDTSLEGSYLTFENGVLNRPTANSSAIEPTLNSSIKVTTGDPAVPVLTAADGEGALTWVAHWIPKGQASLPKVALTVPAGTMKKGKHTSALTWTLATTVNP